jgi:hypothetical protein
MSSRNLTTDIFKKKKRVPKMTDFDILRGVPGRSSVTDANLDVLHEN